MVFQSPPAAFELIRASSVAGNPPLNTRVTLFV
jgi:hypothetical protein